MFSIWHSIFSAKHANLVRVPLLLFLVIVYESEAHKMKYCGSKLIKMFEMCEKADCSQFGSVENPDAVEKFEIAAQCCKRGCSHRDVEAYCCGVDPSTLIEPNNKTPKTSSISVEPASVQMEKKFLNEEQPELAALWKPFYFV
uniref:Insulin-like domain-containing protein n=1 Tax=Acrobeloides nanus TaxID=290746 RepID=A0A914E665_9BILA